MANYDELRLYIQNSIKGNGNREITGFLLQAVLLNIVDVLGDSVANGGSSFVFDSAMSNTSTNGVQNKVIKAFVESEAKKAQIAAEQYIRDEVLLDFATKTFAENEAKKAQAAAEQYIQDEVLTDYATAKYVEEREEYLVGYTEKQVTALENDIKANPASFITLKTINNQSLFGSGNLEVKTTVDWKDVQNKIVNGNEFRFLPSEYKDSVINLNYLTVDNQALTTAVGEYRFFNGTRGYASIRANAFAVLGGTSSQYLKGDGSLDSNAYVITNARYGNIDINQIYDSSIWGLGLVTNAPYNYGAVLTMAYRKPMGNEKPDYAAQIFIPNGDQTNTSMKYRTSHADYWDSWRTVIDDSNIGSYALPLTGGTIESAGIPLTIKRTNNPYSIISFYGIVDGTSQHFGYLGFSGVGEPIYMTSGGSERILLHSGNIGEYAVMEAEAASTFVLKFGYSASGVDFNSLTSGGMLTNYGDTKVWKNAPSGMSYGAGINFKAKDYNYLSGQLAWDVNHGSTDTTRYLWWRADDSNAFANAKWHRIAFTDSNVASATKLQTPRTIWGQSFDGKGNITGSFYLGSGWMYADNSNPIIIQDSAAVSFGYGNVSKGMNTYVDGSTIIFRTQYYGARMLINTDGNVTIGASDLAGTSNKLYVNGIAYATSGLYASSVSINRHPSTGGILNTSLSALKIEAYASDVRVNVYKPTAAAATALTLFNNGSLGVGTTSYNNYLLDVAGTGRFTGLASFDAGMKIGDATLTWDTKNISISKPIVVNTSVTSTLLASTGSIFAATYIKAQTYVEAPHLEVGNTIMLNGKQIGSWDEIGGGDITIVEQTTTSGSAAINPNVINRWGTLISGNNITISFQGAVAGVANYYMIEFTVGSSAPTITLPSDVVWMNSYDILANLLPNTKYQISVMNNLAVGGAFN